MQTLTEPEYRNAIREKYGEVLKSCRNLVTQEDIRQVRRAFDIALKNETSAEKLNYREILRILDITLIITQEIGLGRTSVICALVHKPVEKDLLPLDEVRQDLEGLQTVRNLARNMLWLLRCIEAGEHAGIRPPQAESGARTSFVR